MQAGTLSNLNRALAVWRDCHCECPHSMTAAVNDLLGIKRSGTNIKTKEKKRARSSFPGIVRHAEILGVRREHLWMVLVGQRESRSLRARYAALTGRAS